MHMRNISSEDMCTHKGQLAQRAHVHIRDISSEDTCAHKGHKLRGHMCTLGILKIPHQVKNRVGLIGRCCGKI